MMNVKSIFMLLFALIGCYAPRSIPITNNLAMHLSEEDKWDLFTLLEKSFDDEIERITLDTVHGGFPVATIHFAPKTLDVHTFEYGTCSVWHEDWRGGWGRVLDVKIRKGKWYSDLQIDKIIKWQFSLKKQSVLIPKVQEATYSEIREILEKIDNGDYLIAESKPDETPMDMDWNTVIWIEKTLENGDVLYKIWTKTGKYQGAIYEFALRDGKLYFIGGGAWMA